MVLTCCQEQGWQIQRNFGYTGDGMVDGRVLILGKLYVIQVKRYNNHINAEHIKDFLYCIEHEQASGGFFMHTGKTGNLLKQLLHDSHKIILVSGQKLVNFVLDKQLKIIGITIPVKCSAIATSCFTTGLEAGGLIFTFIAYCPSTFKEFISNSKAFDFALEEWASSSNSDLSLVYNFTLCLARLIAT